MSTSGMPTDDDLVNDAYDKYDQSSQSNKDFNENEIENFVQKNVTRTEAKFHLEQLRYFFESQVNSADSFNLLSGLENLVDAALFEQKQRKITDYFVEHVNL